MRSIFTDKYVTTIIYLLKLIRGLKGVSQESLAEHIGVSKQSVSMWERGNIFPSKDNLELWMDTLIKAKKETGNNEKLDLNYLAGFFDGDGSISIKRQNHPQSTRGVCYTLQVAVTNTNKEIVEHFKKVWKAGHIQTKTPLKQTHKTAYVWRVTGRTAKMVLEPLLPFLRVRKEQAVLALEFQTYKNYSQSESNFEKQLEIRNKIHLLNVGHLFY